MLSSSGSSDGQTFTARQGKLANNLLRVDHGISGVNGGPYILGSMGVPGLIARQQRQCRYPVQCPDGISCCPAGTYSVSRLQPDHSSSVECARYSH